ncbi:MAG TPA: hypothetical protein VFE59_20830 [Trebonia sp.]|nr:hypothetical protein [Trebonia sp.]
MAKLQIKVALEELLAAVPLFRSATMARPTGWATESRMIDRLIPAVEPVR